MTSPASSATVVLVHGAFADASSWSRVVRRLSAAGVTAVAAANPLRGLTADGEYIASLVSHIEGSVLLVGHSYGGPVITYASAKAENVEGLVFVASFGVDQGVSALGSNENFPPAELDTALLPRTFPRGEETGTEFYIQPEQFHSVFCADLPDDEAAVLAVSQRPAADVAFGEPLAVEPGWKKLPSWFVVAGADHAINPDAERAAAKRIGATVTEIDGGSHAIALSHPDEVAQVILGALGEIG
ncbi:alpha/beta hydrolase [Streptomyces sp. NPDC048309]|uniref:alpha/beta fold hydrolase n=1 Tax=unclassified Streptomyces TaxID=2593676 RepID=UPI00340197E4